MQTMWGCTLLWTSGLYVFRMSSVADLICVPRVYWVTSTLILVVRFKCFYVHNNGRLIVYLRDYVNRILTQINYTSVILLLVITCIDYIKMDSTEIKDTFNICINTFKVLVSKFTHDYSLTSNEGFGIIIN